VGGRGRTHAVGAPRAVIVRGGHVPGSAPGVVPVAAPRHPVDNVADVAKDVLPIHRDLLQLPAGCRAGPVSSVKNLTLESTGNDQIRLFLGSKLRMGFLVRPAQCTWPEQRYPTHPPTPLTGLL